MAQEGGRDAATSRTDIHASPTRLRLAGEPEATAARIERGGYELSWEERDTFEGYVRFHARDGFGNRVEVMCPVAEHDASH